MTSTKRIERQAVTGRSGVRAGVLAGALTLGMVAAACGQSENLNRIIPPAPAIETPKSPVLPADYPAPDVIARSAPKSPGLPADYPAPDVIAGPAPDRAPVTGSVFVHRS